MGNVGVCGVNGEGFLLVPWDGRTWGNCRVRYWLCRALDMRSERGVSLFWVLIYALLSRFRPLVSSPTRFPTTGVHIGLDLGDHACPL
jgi:hypothetical protein